VNANEGNLTFDIDSSDSLLPVARVVQEPESMEGSEPVPLLLQAKDCLPYAASDKQPLVR